MRRSSLRGLLAPILALGALPLPFGSALAHEVRFDTTGFQDPGTLKNLLLQFAASKTDIDEMAATYQGDWIVVAEGRVVSSSGIPRELIDKVEEYLSKKLEIDVIAFTPSLGWIVMAEHLGWHSGGGISYVSELETQILERLNKGARITEICFDADDDGWTLMSGDFAYSVAMDAEVYDAVYERRATGRTVKQICMNVSDNLCVLADDWAATRGLPRAAYLDLRELAADETRIDHMMLARGGWVFWSEGDFAYDPNLGIHWLEHELRDTNTGLRKNLWQRMAELKVPGVSLALVEDGKLRWARTYGELEVGTQRWARTDSPFDAASCSKFLGAMTDLVIMDWRKDLDLDLDTSLGEVAMSGGWNPLMLWLVFGNTYRPDPVPSGVITFRHLRAHQACLTPKSSASFPEGDLPPNAFQKLMGQTKQGGPYGGGFMVWYDPDILDDGGDYEPGDVYKYSAGGFLTADTMMEVETGLPYATLMDQYLFQPLSMTNTTATQPLDPTFAARAAVFHNNGVAATSRPYYTWASAGGVYTTPTDYSNALITAMNEGVSPWGGRLIEEDSVESLLTDQFPGGNLYGLGVGLSSSFVREENDEWFSHTGSHDGRSKALMAGSPGRKEGLVVMLNDGSDASATLRTEIYLAFQAFYGWN